MKKNKIIIISIVTLLVALLGYRVIKTETKEKDISKENKPSSSLTVVVHNPVTKIVKNEISLEGNVLAWQESIITSEVSNVRISDIYVDVGTVVKKGQVLLKLEDEVIKAEYNQANATYMESLANLDKAKDDADRVRSLGKSNALSKQEMNQYFATEKASKAKVESARANVVLQEIRLKKTNIISPDDGIISFRNASVGSVVGTDALFKVIRKERLQWIPRLSSEQISQIKKGQEVIVFDKLNNSIKANINEIAPIVDEKTRQGTAIVYLNKEQHQNKIKANMFVSGKINIGDKNVILIEQQAVVLKDGFHYVYVLKPDNRVLQTKVEIGQSYDDYIEIKSGINQENKIVVVGAIFLNDNDLVKVVEK